jgi:hypothetical protein
MVAGWKGSKACSLYVLDRDSGKSGWGNTVGGSLTVQWKKAIGSTWIHPFA